MRSRKFSITVAGRKRPDPISIVLRSPHFTPEEAEALVFFIMKALNRTKIQ